MQPITTSRLAHNNAAVRVCVCVRRQYPNPVASVSHDEVTCNSLDIQSVCVCVTER